MTNDGRTLSGFAGLLLAIPARSNQNRDELAAAWKEGGGNILALHEFWSPPALDIDRVRCYGPYVFCSTLCERLRLEMVSPREDLLVHLPYQYVNRQISLTSLGVVRANSAWPLFVKPVCPKLFPGKVFTDRFELLRVCWGMSEDTALLSSEVVSFESEARAFVLDRQVVDCAFYTGEGKREEVLEFLSDLLSEAINLPETVVVDVGHISGRGWAVVEFNPVWGAASRGCDIKQVASCVAIATRATRVG